MRKGIRAKLTIKNGRNMITIINVYAPHSELTKQKPQDTEKFYDTLDNLIKKLQNESSITIVAGDLNASVGKRIDEHLNCIGNYSKGECNTNGEHLIELCETHNLILTNTCFPHKQSHSTTWQQTRINKNTGKIEHVRKVIDFIAIEDQYKHLLTNARTYQGTTTDSDHRMLITTLNVDWHQAHKYKDTKSRDKTHEFNTHMLVQDTEVKQQYQ